MELYDGIRHVETIAILAIFKNCGEYLNSVLFPSFEKFEINYSVKFSYYFLENDSIDDTKPIISRFMEKRDGFLHTHFNGPFNRESTTQYSLQFSRTSKMAYLWNILLDACRKHIVGIGWLLLIDGGIYFNEDILYRLFSKYPAKNNIGMLSPYSCDIALQADGRFLSLNHYYDTSALVYTDGINTLPFCRFEKCTSCFNSEVRNTLSTISMVQYIVDVNSCFGGFLLVDNSYMTNINIKWDTIGLYNTALCEHILFCNSFRSITTKRICIAQDIMIWHNELNIRK